MITKYTNKEVLEIITNKLLNLGFTRKRVTKGWLIFTLGDNQFNITKKFARFEIRKIDDKITLSAMIAVVSKGGDRVSKIHWAQTKRVKPDTFNTLAISLVKDMLLEMKK